MAKGVHVMPHPYPKMDREVYQLIGKIKDLEQKLERANAKLKRIQTACEHDWSEPVYDPIIHKAYDVPTVKQGSDFWPGGHVPEQRVPRWHRRCHICGLVQVTDKSEEHVKKTVTPKFPSR
jgi:hypothetical protein